MKKIIIILCLAYELFATVITKDKTFEEFILPSQMATTFTIVKKSQKTLDIQSLFNDAINITKQSNICKGGNYYIVPDYEYKTYNKKQKREFIGYSSKISFNCTFDDVKKYDKVVSKIKTLEVKELSLGTINWKATKQEINDSYENLEVKALNYSKDYNGKLNGILNSKCKTLSISFNPKSNYAPKVYSQRMMLSSAAHSESITTEPIKEDLKVNLKVMYEFECKEL